MSRSKNRCACEALCEQAAAFSLILNAQSVWADLDRKSVV